MNITDIYLIFNILIYGHYMYLELIYFLALLFYSFHYTILFIFCHIYLKYFIF